MNEVCCIFPVGKVVLIIQSILQGCWGKLSGAVGNQTAVPLQILTTLQMFNNQTCFKQGSESFSNV